jgi:uncharacterized protein with HEPN domain
MKRKREIRDYLSDILKSIELIENFIKDVNLESIEEDKKTLFAVIRALEVIGEASKNIPDTVRSKYPDIPWKQMAGMRDKLIHEYFGVDLDVLKKTITKQLPHIKPLIKKVFHDMQEHDNENKDF